MIAVAVLVDDRGSSFESDSGSESSDTGISLGSNDEGKISQSTSLLKTDAQLNDYNSLSGNLSTTPQTQMIDASVVLGVVRPLVGLGYALNRSSGLHGVANK